MSTGFVARTLVVACLLAATAGCGRLNFQLDSDPDQAVSDAGVMDADVMDADVMNEGSVGPDLSVDAGQSDGGTGAVIVMIRRPDAGPWDFGVDAGPVLPDADAGVIGSDADAGADDGVVSIAPTKDACVGFRLDADDCWDGIVPEGASWTRHVGWPFSPSSDADYYVVDLFEAPTSVIDLLHASGRRVICSFNAGYRESWRSDASEFTSTDYAQGTSGSQGLRRLNVNSENVRRVMSERMDLAVDKRCDGVEPQDVDAGLIMSSSSSVADQLNYSRFLAAEAHDHGLSVGLTNSVELLSLLEPDFDWASNESCFVYDECRGYSAFIDAGKAVLHTEYAADYWWTNEAVEYICGDPSLASFSTVIQAELFGGWSVPCP